MLKQLEAKYAVFDSVEAMLTPEALSKILNRNVVHVTCQPFEEAKGASDSQFYLVRADDQRLVMKITHMLSDWLALGSVDLCYRSVRLWQYGLLDRLQPQLNHAILAAGCDGDDCVLLMQDVSSGMTTMGQELTIKSVRSILDAVAAMHAIFWDDKDLGNPELGLSDVETFVTAFWPVNFHRNGYDNPHIEKYWGLLFDMVEPDVRDAIQSLLANPTVLFEKLANYPSTLVHGDFKPGNIVMRPETNQLLAIDWQLAAYAPPIIDVHWFLTSCDTVIPFDGIGYYRHQLEIRLGSRFDPKRWQSMLELGYLAAVLRLGWVHAKHSHEDIVECWRNSAATFNDIVRTGLMWL